MPTDAAHAGEDLSGDQEGVEEVDGGIQEVFVGADEVVFVAAKGVSSEVVDRVVVDADFLLEAELVDGADDLAVAGAVIGDEVFEGSALGGGVFEVASDGIDVESGAVHEETSAASGFEDIVAGVEIDRPDAHLEEDVVFDEFDDVFGGP